MKYFQAGTEILNAPVGRAWRWRRCPACRTVERASDFAVLEYREPWRHGGIRRRCPTCSHEAPTWKFQVVRERHP